MCAATQSGRCVWLARERPWNLDQQGVKRAYAIFNYCYRNFGIMNATTMAAARQIAPAC
jgi:hypothetical protein